MEGTNFLFMFLCAPLLVGCVVIYSAGWFLLGRELKRIHPKAEDR